MNKKERDYLVWAISCALLAGFLTFFYLNSLGTREKQQYEAKLASLGKKVTIVVPLRNIPAGSLLSSRDITIKMVPKTYRHPHAVTKASSVIGKEALVDLFAEEQILKSRISKGDAQIFSRAISPGKVGIAIAVDEISAVGGSIKPGDHVDILTTTEGESETKLLYQNILVREVGGFNHEGKNSEDGKDTFRTTTYAGDSSPNLILEVTSEQAKGITFASETGKIKFVLKSARR